MDMTLLQIEGIDEFAREMGVYEQVHKITEAAMRGEIEFRESLNQRFALLKGLTLDQIENVKKRAPITKGARELFAELKKQGHVTALISGGFGVIGNWVKKELAIDYTAMNELKLVNGVCTGEVTPPVMSAQMKADKLIEFAKKEAIELKNSVAVGDGANDIEMFKASGFGIALCGKPKLKPYAKLCIESPDLSPIIGLL